ncbi:MAG: HAMP domain-containing protein [Phycisphaerales bacterium]|nr:MAG: HAMP domain-containing protein [Phycisphaerales bacterium]
MKSRIAWKFLGAFIFLTLIAVFVLNFFVSLKLRDHFEQKISEKLQSNAILVGEILKHELREQNLEDIQQKTNTLANDLDLRITVVDCQGKVLGDSGKDPSLMDDHKDRLEIIEAMESGFGQSTRPSDTLGYNMKYVAVRVDDDGGPLGVIRFALPLSEVQLQIRTIYRAVLSGAIVATVIAVTVAYFVSRSITSPIREMTEVAQRIARGDFSRQVKAKSRDELGELAESLNAMAEELQRTIENLKRMDRVRTDFVANVSHELKTPLTLIKGYIETLENKALDDKEGARKFIAIVKEHADRLSNIVDDLLTLSELELSERRIEKSQCDLKGLVDEVVLGFGHALASRQQKLNVELLGGDFGIQADRDKIEQVFVNLIDNAIKYSPNTGEIEVSLTERPNAVEVRVKDGGVGILKEHLDRVFERFYRVDKARSRELGGTGLGLGIAKHIVLAHGGQINIESEINKGTVVSVTLPRQ